MAGEKKTFIVRALFHHTRETSKEDFILAEWRKANQQLIEAGSRRDNLMGENKLQQFIS